MPLVKRLVKGVRLTHTEMDGNFVYLENKIDSASDSGYIKGIIDSIYLKGIIDSDYMDSLLFDNYLDSSDAISLIDSAYVNARLNTSLFLDSAEAIDIINDHVDSAYVNSKLDTSLFLDSAELAQVVNAPYVQARQSYAWASLTGVPSFSAIATSGAYSDLSGTPTLSTAATSGAYSDLSGTPVLSTVATSGAYSDLSGTPALSTVATSGAYSDLSGTPALSTVATSGDYTDLSNTPSVLDSAFVLALIPNFLDSADVLALIPGGGLDSANVTSIIEETVDSDFVQGKADKVKLKVFATADSSQYNSLDAGTLIFLSDGNAGDPCLAIKDSAGGFFRVVSTLGAQVSDGGGGGGGF